MEKSAHVSPQPIIAKRNLSLYALFVFIVLTFGYIVAKDVSLPRAVTLPIILLGLGILLFSLFNSSRIPFLILIAYLPFNNILVGQFGSDITGFNLTNIFSMLVGMAWVIHAASQNERIFARSSLNAPILIFCCMGFASLLRARYMYGSEYELWGFFILFKRWIMPVLLYFVALNVVRDRETFKKAIFIILTVTVVVGLMAIRDYMNDSEARTGSVFLQPNMMGAFFVYNMFFFAGFFLYNMGSFRYWLLLIPFMICFRGIMVSFSRGAYVACAFGGVMTTFFRNKLLFIVCTAMLIFALVNPEYLPAGIRYRMGSTFGGEKVVTTHVEDITDPSVNTRLDVWTGAMAMIKAQPLLGFGYGTFPYIIGHYAPGLAGADAHNTYLIIAAEMGIPALIVFVLILLMLAKNAWWILRHVEDRYFKAVALGLLGGIFGLIVANIFGSRLNSEDVSSYFWILSGLTMRAVLFRKEGVIK
jgi:O-antigen ligase